MAMIERIKQRYLTWRTGKTQKQRDWEAWYEVTVNYRANDITNMFENFQHVIEVDWNKFITDGGLSWVPVPDARQYFWPQRPLGENCVWRMERVAWNPWDQRWHLSEIGGEDRVFVATNNEKDAIMIALQYK